MNLIFNFCFSFVILVMVSCESHESFGLKMVIPESNATRHVDTSAHDLPSDVLVIFEDSRGSYWFGSMKNGAYRYDGKSLRRYTTSDGLKSNRIRDIQEDHNGVIFIDTGEGVSRLKDDVFEPMVPRLDTSGDSWTMGAEDIWFAGNWDGKGPLRYNGTDLIQLQFPRHPLEDEFFNSHPGASYSPYQVYTTHKDSKGNVWFGTATFGPGRFDGRSVRWMMERELMEIDDGPAPGIRSIVQDKNGDFWFSANVNHKYQVSEDYVSAQNSISLDYGKLQGINTELQTGMNPYFMAMVEDHLGRFWMATHRNGVWQYDKGTLKHYPVKVGDDSVLIHRISKDNHGDLWLTTLNAGVMRLESNEFRQIRLDEIMDPRD